MKYSALSFLALSLGMFSQDARGFFDPDPPPPPAVEVNVDEFVGNRVPFRKDYNRVVVDPADISGSLANAGERNRDYYGYDNLNDVDPFFAISAATYRIQHDAATVTDYRNRFNQGIYSGISSQRGVVNSASPDGEFGSDTYFDNLVAADSIRPMGGFSNPLCLRPARAAIGNSIIWNIMFDEGTTGYEIGAVDYNLWFGTPVGAGMNPVANSPRFITTQTAVVDHRDGQLYDRDGIYNRYANERLNFTGGGHETVEYDAVEPAFYGPDESLRTVYRHGYRCLDNLYDPAVIAGSGFVPGREVKLHAYSCNGNSDEECRERAGGRALLGFFQDGAPPSDKSDTVHKDWADILTPAPSGDPTITVPYNANGSMPHLDETFYNRYDVFNVRGFYHFHGREPASQFNSASYAAAYMARSIYSRGNDYAAFSGVNDLIPRTNASPSDIADFANLGAASVDAPVSLARWFCEGASDDNVWLLVNNRQNREEGAFTDYIGIDFFPGSSDSDLFSCARMSYDFLDECHEADYFGSQVLDPANLNQGLGTRAERVGCRF